MQQSIALISANAIRIWFQLPTVAALSHEQDRTWNRQFLVQSTASHMLSWRRFIYLHGRCSWAVNTRGFIRETNPCLVLVPENILHFYSAANSASLCRAICCEQKVRMGIVTYMYNKSLCNYYNGPHTRIYNNYYKITSYMYNKSLCTYE